MVSWIQLFKLRRFSQKVVENNLDSLQENIGYKIGCPCMAFNWEIFPFVFTHTHTHTPPPPPPPGSFAHTKTLAMNIRNYIKILLHLQSYTVWLNKDFITSSKLHRLTEENAAQTNTVWPESEVDMRSAIRFARMEPKQPQTLRGTQSTNTADKEKTFKSRCSHPKPSWFLLLNFEHVKQRQRNSTYMKAYKYAFIH